MISKGMGIEQAKIITSQSDFASPSTAIQTFISANTDKEGEKLLERITKLKEMGVDISDDDLKNEKIGKKWQKHGYFHQKLLHCGHPKSDFSQF